VKAVRKHEKCGAAAAVAAAAAAAAACCDAGAPAYPHSQLYLLPIQQTSAHNPHTRAVMSDRDDISFLHGDDPSSSPSPPVGSRPAPRPASNLSDDFVRKIDYAILSAAFAIIVVIVAAGLSSPRPLEPLPLPALVACSARPDGTNGSLADMRSYFDALARHAAAAALPLNRNL
jgi:hypothetical protein